MPPVKKQPVTRHRHYLKEWRVYRDLSLEVAADRIDVHHATLSRIENYKLPYNQDFLERCALAYGCDLADLLTMDPSAPRTEENVLAKLKKASPELKAQVFTVIEALLKSVA